MDVGTGVASSLLSHLLIDYCPQKLFREDPKAYRRKVRDCAMRSLEE